MGKAGTGYSKPKKRKYFTKKDVISTVIVVAIIAVVVAVIAIAINRDDFIRVSDGKLEMEDNWLIANYSESSKALYYKVGEIGDIDGYTLDAGSAQSTVKSLTPESDDALIKAIYVGTYDSDYETVTDIMIERFKDVNGPFDITCAGRDAKYITSFSSADDVETDGTAEGEAESGDETGAAANDAWILIAYIDYDDGHCAYIQLNSETELTQAEAEEQLAIVAAALTLEDR
jgi:hypothetical protein